jgi:hypothetical protein
MRQLFYMIRKSISDKWTDFEVPLFTAVTGFIFLRFFNAAILGPQLFGLLPGSTHTRTHTLSRKLMQQSILEKAQDER